MCVSVLAQVVEVDDVGAIVACDEVQRRAGTRLYPDIRVGEWVLVGAGTILQRLSADEARLLAGTVVGPALRIAGNEE